ncbi:MAG: hypothetical protein L0Y71_18020 [Gemmataceae bacterium]|nr:hypothetical protein [Gemmataceae bacterium]
MANKFLTLAGLKAAVAKSEAKDLAKHLVDGVSLGHWIRVYEINEERVDVARNALDEVIKAGPAAKKKAAADKAVLKYVDDVVKAATAERKKIETDLVKLGMKKINKVQVVIKDWKGEPMHNRRVWVVFKCPGKEDVSLGQEVKAGNMNFTAVELAPKGSIFVNAFPSNGVSDQARGIKPYDLPNKSHVTIEVTQGNKKKKRDKKGEDAAKKLGLKGTAGIDFIVKAEGEILKENETKTTKEEEVEFEFTEPEGTLDIKLA